MMHPLTDDARWTVRGCDTEVAICRRCGELYELSRHRSEYCPDCYYGADY